MAKNIAPVLDPAYVAGVKLVWDDEAVRSELHRAEAEIRRANAGWSHAPKAPWTRVNNCAELAAQSAATTAPKQIDGSIDSDGRYVSDVCRPLM